MFGLREDITFADEHVELDLLAIRVPAPQSSDTCYLTKGGTRIAYDVCRGCRKEGQGHNLTTRSTTRT